MKDCCGILKSCTSEVSISFGNNGLAMNAKCAHCAIWMCVCFHLHPLSSRTHPNRNGILSETELNANSKMRVNFREIQLVRLVANLSQLENGKFITFQHFARMIHRNVTLSHFNTFQFDLVTTLFGFLHRISHIAI